jgi:hypothetical protein
MKTIKKTVKPISLFLAILLLLISTLSQSASATMIGTEYVLKSNRNQDTREYLHQLISREKIQKAIVARGITPLEAKARIDSLTDDEIELISEKIADLAAGGNAIGFIVIVGAIILVLILIVEHSSVVKMFSKLKSNN